MKYGEEPLKLEVDRICYITESQVFGWRNKTGNKEKIWYLRADYQDVIVLAYCYGTRDEVKHNYQVGYVLQDGEFEEFLPKWLRRLCDVVDAALAHPKFALRCIEFNRRHHYQVECRLPLWKEAIKILNGGALPKIGECNDITRLPIYSRDHSYSHNLGEEQTFFQYLQSPSNTGLYRKVVDIHYLLEEYRDQFWQLAEAEGYLPRYEASSEKLAREIIKRWKRVLRKETAKFRDEKVVAANLDSFKDAVKLALQQDLSVDELHRAVDEAVVTEVMEK